MMIYLARVVETGEGEREREREREQKQKNDEMTDTCLVLGRAGGLAGAWQSWSYERPRAEARKSEV